jgi:hypothetical protein
MTNDASGRLDCRLLTVCRMVERRLLRVVGALCGLQQSVETEVQRWTDVCAGSCPWERSITTLWALFGRAEKMHPLEHPQKRLWKDDSHRAAN